MNEKLQYASMLEIPVNTCKVTYKPLKKRRLRGKKPKACEEVKNELVKKVNAVAERENIAEPREQNARYAEERGNAEFARAESGAYTENGAYAENRAETSHAAENLAERETFREIPATESAGANVFSEKAESTDFSGDDGRSVVKYNSRAKKAKREKKKFGISAIGVELAVIGALVAVIFLTSAFYPQSGVGAFIKSVFGNKETAAAIDERTYEEFAPVIKTADGETLKLEGGEVTVSGKGSVYSPLGGVVKSVTADGNGRFSMEIAHSEKFCTVISGIDYAYAAVGDKVYGNIPVGYVKESGVKMCFTGENGAVITDYELSGNAVVWAV